MTKITTDAEALAVLDAVINDDAVDSEVALLHVRFYFTSRIAQHERIVAGLEADAARYRWLRDRHCPFAETDSAWDDGESLDTAIDAFLAQTAEG